MLFGLVRMWFLGLIGIGLWVGVFFLARGWSHRLPDPRPTPVVVVPNDQLPPNGRPPPPEPPPPSFSERVSAWRPGADAATAYLAGAVILSLLGVGGGRALFWLLLPRRKDDPRHERDAPARRVKRPDGTELHVEVGGNPTGPTVVLTHGWEANATEWFYLRRHLGDKYRLVAWDLPGLGRSKGPADKNFALDKLAADLRAVLDEVGGGPAVLLWHSIGGMISLTFARNYPDELGARVAGLVLVHTTHTNPLRTMQMAGLYTALQKPVVEPLAYLMIGLAPVVWVMNAASYLNGSQHLSMYRQAFSWAGTWGQVEFATRYVLQAWPAVYARGLLGMFRTYHATDALGGVTVPTLVVAADRDKICTPEAGRDIRAGVPHGEMATLSPAGHMGLLSSHEEFGRAVRGFLDRVLPGARPVGAGGVKGTARLG